MKRQATTMGMPATIELLDTHATEEDIDLVLEYYDHIDRKFSTYKPDSEIELINRGELPRDESSDEMRHVLKLCEETTAATSGFFDIHINGRLDPSGLVKGLAIYSAAERLRQRGHRNFLLEIGGDAELRGNCGRSRWRAGIENPFCPDELIKVLELSDHGIATSGTYLRGEHIYDPVHRQPAVSTASVTVIAANVYEADRYATAAYAMGEYGILFLETVPGCEGYMVKRNGRAVLTSGFEGYVVH